MLPRPPSSTLFPYTTLFRSCPPRARYALTSVPIYSSCRLRASHRSNSSRSVVPGILKAPQIQDESGCGCFTWIRSEEHTSELQSRVDLVCRLLLEKKKETTH